LDKRQVLRALKKLRETGFWVSDDILSKVSREL
jgi:predicted nucleic acid-binding protein